MQMSMDAVSILPLLINGKESLKIVRDSSLLFHNFIQLLNLVSEKVL